ncbi:50S ribosomal protein L33 [Streptococcus pneumoniae 13856]|nr:50S ribosomal protein L33 [Streptococcus pneumoniae 13856]
MRVNITLEHKESGERLYLTSKNKRNTPDRLQLKKYSPNFANTLCLQKLNN